MAADVANVDVIVLGGGAAGLMCAITAAKRGRRVLVLEKSNKVGKKILMSGGGRCNFTNLVIDAENYISTNNHFCHAALNRYTQWDFINLVEEHGIDYEERKHGQLFCKASAKDILAMLLKECEASGVEIKTDCEIQSIKALLENDESYRYALQVRTKKAIEPQVLKCESVVVATGGLSIPTLGGSAIGYDIAQQFAMPLVERRAGLVPFMFSDYMKPICERLSGLALEVEVNCNGQYFRENMLFTHRGISGPGMLQISNYWSPGDELGINFLPDIETSTWLLESKHGNSMHLKTLLNQKLAKSLVNEMQTLWWPSFSETPLAEIPDKVLLAIARHLNEFNVKPSGTEGYRTAEVTLGGVDTSSVSSKTMEAKAQPGLFFIGEVLDVSGHLGGFNFQWAWSSAYSAGLYV